MRRRGAIVASALLFLGGMLCVGASFYPPRTRLERTLVLVQAHLDHVPFPTVCPLRLRAGLLRQQINLTLNSELRDVLVPGSLRTQVSMVGGNVYSLNARLVLRPDDQNVVLHMSSRGQAKVTYCPR